MKNTGTYTHFWLVADCGRYTSSTPTTACFTACKCRLITEIDVKMRVFGSEPKRISCRERVSCKTCHVDCFDFVEFATNLRSKKLRRINVCWNSLRKIRLAVQTIDSQNTIRKSSYDWSEPTLNSFILSQQCVFNEMKTTAIESLTISEVSTKSSEASQSASYSVRLQLVSSWFLWRKRFNHRHAIFGWNGNKKISNNNNEYLLVKYTIPSSAALDKRGYLSNYLDSMNSH